MKHSQFKPKLAVSHTQALNSAIAEMNVLCRKFNPAHVDGVPGKNPHNALTELAGLYDELQANSKGQTVALPSIFKREHRTMNPGGGTPVSTIVSPLPPNVAARVEAVKAAGKIALAAEQASAPAPRTGSDGILDRACKMFGEAEVFALVDKHGDTEAARVLGARMEGRTVVPLFGIAKVQQAIRAQLASPAKQVQETRTPSTHTLPMSPLQRVQAAFKSQIANA